MTAREAQHRSLAGQAALSPDDTYFVVFRFGAVVMFQGQQRDQQPKANGRNVAPPVDAPYPSGPWDTDRELWADAVAADHEGQLIYLLLRPFMRDALDGIQARPYRPSHALAVTLCAL